MTDITDSCNKTRLELNKKSPSINNINMIQSLMKEMNLNSKLQDEILHFTKNGQSLPYVPKELVTPPNEEEIPLKNPLKLPPRPLQRMKAKIVSTGSYEREPYRPDPSKSSYNSITARPAKEKERLQNMMAFGKDLDEELVKRASKNKDLPPEINSPNLIHQILKEIKEREDFLEEMSQLGLKNKYLPEIQCQISLRLKELEKLQKDKAKKKIMKNLECDISL